MTSGLCECGCGDKTRLAVKSDRRLGWVKGQPLRFIKGHQIRQIGSRHPSWRGGRKLFRKGYVSVWVPQEQRAAMADRLLDGRYVLEHIAVVMAARGGKPLPAGAEPHHVNGNKADNRNCNLVVCQDHAYHGLLERRGRALKACGHPTWLKCRFCKNWDDPANLYVWPNGRKGLHRACHNLYDRDKRKAAALAAMTEKP